MTDKTPPDEPTAEQPAIPEQPTPAAAAAPGPAAETGPVPDPAATPAAAETGPAPAPGQPTLVANPAAYPPPPRQPGAWSRMRSRRVPLLVAVATLLIGCIGGAGVVAVGAVIADLGGHGGGRHMSRDGGYGPGDRGFYPGNGRNDGGPFGSGGRNRRGMMPAQPANPANPMNPASPAPASPAPTPSASS
jgi:hypothetical protein